VRVRRCSAKPQIHNSYNLNNNLNNNPNNSNTNRVRIVSPRSVDRQIYNSVPNLTLKTRTRVVSLCVSMTHFQ